MSIYKANDIRGIVPDELDEKLAEYIGISFANMIQEETGKADVKIITAHDMRLTSKDLVQALHFGMMKAGANVIHIGLSSTPMFYYAVGLLESDGGVTCTASHNPGFYNGFKMVRSENRPVSDESGILEIEKRIKNRKFRFGQEQGKISYKSVNDEYSQKILSYAENTDRKLTVAADAGNGMAVSYLPILDKLGFELDTLYFELDGNFPNHEANPLKPENVVDLQTKMSEKHFDFGFAFDGDADRAIFLDESGKIIPADILTALISQKALELYPGTAVVYDIRSSRIVPETIKKHGGVPVRQKAGHSFIKETMRKTGSYFSGEFSGHYYWRDLFVADDAMMAVVFISNILREANKTLSELVKPLQKYYHSGEINFHVDDKTEMMQNLAQHFDDGEIDWVDGICVKYKTWWFNVRPSNTEQYLRLTVESETREELEQKLTILKELLSNPA